MEKTWTMRRKRYREFFKDFLFRSGFSWPGCRVATCRGMFLDGVPPDGGRYGWMIRFGLIVKWQTKKNRWAWQKFEKSGTSLRDHLKVVTKMSQVVYMFLGTMNPFWAIQVSCCCCCWCQVYCLPFASGSSLVFAPWEDEVIEVVAVAWRPRWRSNQKVDGLQIKGLETQNFDYIVLVGKGWRGDWIYMILNFGEGFFFKSWVLAGNFGWNKSHEKAPGPPNF